MLNLSAPYWQDYRDHLQRLNPAGSVAVSLPGSFPDTHTLNQFLATDIQQASGKPIRFVAAESLPAIAYEQHIFHTGEISTRQNSWHDLFNALVWSRFPRIKAAMNAMHQAEIEAAHQNGGIPARGPTRDALTLFDECGVVLVSRRLEMLQAVAQRDWPALFGGNREAWQQDCVVFVLGHALLEKFLKPYKAITAQVLLFHVDGRFLQQQRSQQRQNIDSKLAAQLRAGTRLRSTAELAPLPLSGIPGWWPEGLQDRDFYADQRVFRAAPENLTPTAILNLETVL